MGKRKNNLPKKLVEAVKMTNSQIFMSRQFVKYLLNEDPNVKFMKYILKYTASADEIFFPTLFALSPYCQEKAHFTHEREFFLYLWPEDKRSAAQHTCKKHHGFVGKALTG